ncbi:MAG: helix-turn-helix domain-containing protein [Clostridia bacterium]|nr:helix-turn-helix domain-containing protein [Clostridia bacterium]
MLLRSSSLSIQEIARLVGYSDPAFFYKTFRREMNVTPDDYRRRHNL